MPDLTANELEQELIIAAQWVDEYGSPLKPWLARLEVEYFELRKPTEADRIRKLLREQKAREALATSLSIGEAAVRYHNEVGQLHANSGTTETDLSRLVEHLGKDMALADITDADVAKLIQWRREHRLWGKEKKADGTPMPLVSAATVNRSTTLVLKKLFTRAKRTWRYTFPLEPIWKDHWLKEPGERVRELKKDESSSLALATRPDYEPIFSFVRATGLRLNECILKWSEVDWQTGWISKPGKGGRTVKTAITSTVRDILTPRVGQHDLYAFLTCEPNTVVAPIHAKAMPVILTRPEEIELWLTAPWEEAKALQRPLNDSELVLLPVESQPA